jgi:hypothetical protein
MENRKYLVIVEISFANPSYFSQLECIDFGNKFNQLTEVIYCRIDLKRSVLDRDTKAVKTLCASRHI